MEYLAYANGKIVPRSELKIDIGDPAFMLGDVVFDMTRCFNGKPFRLKQHLQRLFRSIAGARMDLGMTADQVEQITLDLVKRNDAMRPTGEELHITHMVMRSGVSKETGKQLTSLYIYFRQIAFDAYAKQYLTGARVVLVRTRSFPADTVDPKIKHFSRMNLNIARQEAADIDPAAYALLSDQNGNLTETPSTNFFIVTNGMLRSPSDRQTLQGTSRDIVFELADQLRIPAREDDLQPYDLYTADEMFLTGTSPCIVPVSQVDKQALPHPIPGPLTKQLQAAYSEFAGVDFVDQALTYAEKKGVKLRG